MLCTYTGSDSRMYMDYRDALTGRTLEASPGGGPYDIEVVVPQALSPLPPGDGRWVAAPEDGAPEPEPPAEPTPPFPAAEPAAEVTPEAGDRPADEEN